MEEEMKNVLIAVLAFKKKCKEENKGENEMETILIDLLLSAGVEFSR